MSEEIIHIWNPETGIIGIDENLLGEANECASIAEEWKILRKENGNSQAFISFLEKREMEWAIETGVIEKAFHIPRGTTTLLIEHGYQEKFFNMERQT